VSFGLLGRKLGCIVIGLLASGRGWIHYLDPASIE
jgi:hypothetical protein